MRNMRSKFADIGNTHRKHGSAGIPNGVHPAWPESPDDSIDPTANAFVQEEGSSPAPLAQDPCGASGGEAAEVRPRRFESARQDAEVVGQGSDLKPRGAEGAEADDKETQKYIEEINCLKDRAEELRARNEKLENDLQDKENDIIKLKEQLERQHLNLAANAEGEESLRSLYRGIDKESRKIAAGMNDGLSRANSGFRRDSEKILVELSKCEQLITEGKSTITRLVQETRSDFVARVKYQPYVSLYELAYKQKTLIETTYVHCSHLGANKVEIDNLERINKFNNSIRKQIEQILSTVDLYTFEPQAGERVNPNRHCLESEDIPDTFNGVVETCRVPGIEEKPDEDERHSRIIKRALITTRPFL